MIFGTHATLNKMKEVSISCNNANIDRVEKFKYFGFILDEKLKFDEHVKYTRRKIIPRLKMLGNLTNILSKNIKLILYKTLIVPPLDYVDIIYDGLAVKDGQILQRLQNTALRIILNRDRDTHIKDLHQEANMLTLNICRKHHLCHQIFKGLSDLAPPYLCNKLELVEMDRQRITRSIGQGHLRPKTVRLELCKKNFYYKAPKAWNPLEIDIKQSKDLKCLKTQLYHSNSFQ